jgi:hypothetical protein
MSSGCGCRRWRVLQLECWEWDEQLVTVKNKLVTNCHKGPQTWMGSLDKRPVRSLCRAGFLTTVVKELLKCKLDLVIVQEIRWDRDGTEPAGEYTFLYGKGNENHELGIGFFVHQRIVSAVKRVEIIS